MSRISPVSWEKDEIIDADVTEPSVIHSCVIQEVLSRDVLMPSDDALVELCLQ